MILLGWGSSPFEQTISQFTFQQESIARMKPFISTICSLRQSLNTRYMSSYKGYSPVRPIYPSLHSGCPIQHRFFSIRHSNDPLPSNNNNNNQQQQPPSFLTKLNELRRLYGKTALLSYFTISTSSMLVLYVALNNGIDLASVLKPYLPEGAAKHGPLVAALAINKLLIPAKIGLTVFLTPKIHRLFFKKP